MFPSSQNIAERFVGNNSECRKESFPPNQWRHFRNVLGTKKVFAKYNFYFILTLLNSFCKYSLLLNLF